MPGAQLVVVLPQVAPPRRERHQDLDPRRSVHPLLQNRSLDFLGIVITFPVMLLFLSRGNFIDRGLRHKAGHIFFLVLGSGETAPNVDPRRSA